MSKVIILRGVPGSGKSTWVKNYHLNTPKQFILTVSRDDIRWRLFGTAAAHGVDENLVTKEFNREFRRLLAASSRVDMHIIIDNTNCDIKRVDDLVKMTWGFDIPVEIVVIDTPLDEALRRNAARDRVVPEHVIRRMHDQLQETKDYTL